MTHCMHPQIMSRFSGESADIEKVEEMWRAKKHLDTASLCQSPLKSTECYSPHLHLHLHTHFSHLRYCKQTSICTETCAALLAHVHAACTHQPTTITLCLQSVFSGPSRLRLLWHSSPLSSTVMSQIYSFF